MWVSITFCEIGKLGIYVGTHSEQEGTDQHGDSDNAIILGYRTLVLESCIILCIQNNLKYKRKI